MQHHIVNHLKGGWTVDLQVDDDGHLTVGINHGSNTRVHDVGEDLSTNDTEWVGRFTSDEIEDKYQEGVTDEASTD
jgi:hypothetical protein